MLDKTRAKKKKKEISYEIYRHVELFIRKNPLFSNFFAVAARMIDEGVSR